MVTPELVTPLLEIRDLRTEIRQGDRVVRAVDGVSLEVRPGETLGLVGESGCGKTMTALSVLNLLPPGGVVTGGSIRLNGSQIAGRTDAELRQVRGGQVGMVFQDPLTSLNPTMTVGRQIAQTVLQHRAVSRSAALGRAAEVLDLVGLPSPKERMGEYPHQFSGGMRQRVLIAMALACEPSLLIADEPTTAVDVTVQKQILELIDDLRSRLGMAVILVSHDLGVVAGRTDRVAVMYAGQIVETASTAGLFAGPRHRYTEALFRALPEQATATQERLYTIPGVPPDLSQPRHGCRFAARCEYAEPSCRAEAPVLGPAGAAHQFACFLPAGLEPDRKQVPAPPWLPSEAGSSAEPELLGVRHLVKTFRAAGGLGLPGRAGTVSAVAGVSFSIPAGQTFGLVGESGCGKSTVSRLIAGLDRPEQGQILLDGQDITRSAGRDYRRQRRDIQLMFQDSFASLDPRQRAGQIVAEPLEIQRIGTRQERRERAAEMLERVGLSRSMSRSYPDQFSGGQRQRLALARALILAPRLVIADEPVSALDVSVQAQILNLMRELQRGLGLTYLFISHDLSVVRYLSDQIGVMYLGKLVEVGPASEVYASPAHPYTRGLIDSAPVADPAAERAKARAVIAGDPPSALRPPSGCRFRTRCPAARDLCAEREPELATFSPAGHRAACHFPLIRPLGARAGHV